MFLYSSNICGNRMIWWFINEDDENYILLLFGRNYDLVISIFTPYSTIIGGWKYQDVDLILWYF